MSYSQTQEFPSERTLWSSELNFTDYSEGVKKQICTKIVSKLLKKEVTGPVINSGLGKTWFNRPCTCENNSVRGFFKLVDLLLTNFLLTNPVNFAEITLVKNIVLFQLQTCGLSCWQTSCWQILLTYRDLHLWKI